MKIAVCAFLIAALQFFAWPAGLLAEEAGITEQPASESGVDTEDLPVIQMLELLQLVELLQDMDLLQENGKDSISEDKQ